MTNLTIFVRKSYMFSKACEYGIKATIHIARITQKGERASLKSIAEAIDSPVSFTAKILQSLAQQDIVVSKKGPTGGYELPGDGDHDITLSDVVAAIDGDEIYRGCALGLKKCNANKPCPLHYQFAAIRDDLQEMLENTHVNTLTKGLQEELAFLKR